MKFLRKLLKTKQSSSNPSTSDARFAKGGRWKQRQRRPVESDETSSTEGSGLGSRTTDSSDSRKVKGALSPSTAATSPWKAENFLVNGPFHEADWWQNDVVDDDDDDELNTDDEPPLPQPRVFVNQGFATWQQGRAAWNSQSSAAATSVRPRPLIPDSFRRDLVKCLSDRRQFELSQRIPLSTMIDAYQEVWKANE